MAEIKIITKRILKWLLLLLMIFSFWSLRPKTVDAAMLYRPLICQDGITTYPCGFSKTYYDEWVCGIEMTPGKYDCEARFDSEEEESCKNADVWFKHNGCPLTTDWTTYNTRPCILADPAVTPTGVVALDIKTGSWNAVSSACVLCNGQTRDKLLAESSRKCFNYTSDFWGNFSWEEYPCADDDKGKCDAGCGAHEKCNGLDDAVGINVPGGVCNKCGFTPTCGNGQLDPGEECDGALGACPGSCDPATCLCPPELDPCANCMDTCKVCPSAEECKGGLVPCGRRYDDPLTPTFCECCPCTLCHVFVLFKRIVDFVTLNVVIPLAVLMITIGGIIMLTAAGNPSQINQGKSVLKAVFIGLILFFTAWLIVNTIVTFLTPSDHILRKWYEIECPIP